MIVNKAGFSGWVSSPRSQACPASSGRGGGSHGHVGWRRQGEDQSGINVTLWWTWSVLLIIFMVVTPPAARL